MTSDSRPPEPSSAASVPPGEGPSRRQALLQRALSTTVLWSGVIAGIVWGNAWVWFIVVGLLSLLGVREYLRMLGPTMPQRFRWVAMIGSALYLGLWDWHLWKGGSTQPGLHDGVLVVGLLLGSLLIQFNRPVAERRTLENVTNLVFSVLYAVFLFHFLIRVLFVEGAGDGGKPPGHWYALLLLAVTKCTDMGAFLVGSWLGRSKMAPHISPKKTWEGFCGAILFALLVGLAIWWPLREEMTLLGLTEVLVLAPVLGVAAVLGDLGESVLKRSLMVKDSGRTIPGIGGVLDLIDSICFTAPVLYFALIWLQQRG